MWVWGGKDVKGWWNGVVVMYSFEKSDEVRRREREREGESWKKIDEI